eukprot:scaffold168003_cov33-Tisochrysis_lutea.AAC.2
MKADGFYMRPSVCAKYTRLDDVLAVYWLLSPIRVVLATCEFEQASGVHKRPCTPCVGAKTGASGRNRHATSSK